MPTVMDCEYLATCPIFAKFKNEGLRSMWIALYCQGTKQQECERKRLKKGGREVPMTLLPNGTHLKSLAD